MTREVDGSSPSRPAADPLPIADAHHLARVCYVEATFRRADCAAIYWVAKRREAMTGKHWADALTAYSVLYRSQTPRAREVAAFPWGDVPGKSASFNSRWAALRQYAAELVAGMHESPCPSSAIGWGGDTDSVRPGQQPVSCNGTANWFYARGAVDAQEASGR